MGLFETLSDYKNFIEERNNLYDWGRYINRFDDDILELYNLVRDHFMKEFIDRGLAKTELYSRQLFHSEYSYYEINDLKLFFFNGATVTFERFDLNSIGNYKGGIRISSPWKENIFIIREIGAENKVTWRLRDYPHTPLIKETFLDILEKLIL